MKLTPWQKIIRAANRFKGVHLSAEEVALLWMDDAICTRARNDDLERNTDDDEPGSLRHKSKTPEKFSIDRKAIS